MSYSLWNDRLLRYFFGEFVSGEQVRIAITDELLDSEFDDFGGSEAFKAALRKGPEWPAKMTHGWPSQPDSFLQRCEGLHRQWKGQDERHPEYVESYIDRDGPPFFNYLCGLCLAWTQDAKNDADFFWSARTSLP